MIKADLRQDLKLICDRIRSVIENNSDIQIITHLDADGIAAGSIIATALLRLDAKCSIRTVQEINPEIINEIRSENHDFYIITDLGSGMAAEIKRSLTSRWIIIDHHQISQEEIESDKDTQILNAWKFGIDGGKEISAGGMAYLVANEIDKKNKDLSALAIISALADRQDQGDKKSLVGINSEILEDAKSLGLVDTEIDIMFSGRETKPIHEALASTSFPFIDGITWNKEGCYTILRDAGLKMTENNRWRIISELAEQEKEIIIESISKYIARSKKNTVHIKDNLFGYIYTLTKEDRTGQLRDARDFSILLNACGRNGKAGVGIAICMGDRNTLLSEGEQLVLKYKNTLGSFISSIFKEKWRLIDDGMAVFVNGDGLIREEMLGAVSSLLSGSPTLAGRMLFTRILSTDGSYRFSSRKSLGCNNQLNLGMIMRYCADRVGGNGGGHSAAAGCRIPSSRLDDFISCLKQSLGDPQFAIIS